jgi:hypothetical protein
MAVVLFSVQVVSAQDADSEAPPQEGEAPPPPQEGEPVAPPQEGEPPAPPQDGDAPQEGQVPSQEGEPPTQEGAVPSQEGDAPAQEGETQAPTAPAPSVEAPGLPTPTQEPPAPTPVEPPPPAEPVPPPGKDVVVFVDEEPAEPVAASDAPLAKPAGCKSRWGCWDLLHSTKGSVLGGRGGLGYSWHKRENSLDAGFVAIYMTEHFATHDYMTVHFAGVGALGRGTAGTEGIVSVALDFGFRAKVSELSGPFLRFGMQGFLFGQSDFHVGFLEPLSARAGYQYLNGEVLYEFGLTQGFVPLARYSVLEGSLDPSRSTELGGYAALRLPPLRINGSFMQLLSGRGARADTLQMGRLSVCSYELTVTLCADAMYTRGRVYQGTRGMLAQGIHGGITIGLSP